MEQKYDQYQEESIQPNAILYNSLVDTYAHSSLVYKAEQAHVLLVWMREQCDVEGREYLWPDIITHTSELHKELYSQENNSTKTRAQTRIENLGPTSVSYVLMIANTLWKLIEPDDEQYDMIQRIGGEKNFQNYFQSVIVV
eukprot:7508443-Ditylum_brightwellii.AAC.1